MNSKVSKYQFRWVGFKVVRGLTGSVSKEMNSLGFFKAHKRMGFDYVRPCGPDAGTTLGKMRELEIKGVAHVFTDANWMIGKITTKQASCNYAE
jgi:hypothetical protein